MKKLFRTLAITATAAISAVSVLAFTGCSTDYPEITITYEFNGTEYEVEYKLTRKGAPHTVQHFIELADAGYFDGTVIHDYESGGTFLYGGGYELGEDGALVEKDYWTEVKKLEEEGNTFTQTVFNEEDGSPLYTVHGEFKDNGIDANNKSYWQNNPGTLVMYYADKGNDRTTTVSTLRYDNEKQEGDLYRYNSATSLFYTFTGSGYRTDLDDAYCAFGRTIDFDGQLQPLLDAINKFTDERDEAFTKEEKFILNQFDPFTRVREAKIPATYNVPVEPILIKSVVVNKY